MISFKQALENSILICFNNFIYILFLNLLLHVFSSGVKDSYNLRWLDNIFPCLK